MFNSYFTSNQQIQLSIALLLLILSVIFFEFSKKHKLALVLLITGIFVLKLFYALLDPFLHYWDEQVHALVAKNLTHNFLKPTLFPEEIFPFDHKNWVGNYIWVHKQPLFLWQIAISYKIFGVNIFALRFPSVICGTFTVFFIYRIGKNFANERIGFYGALFFGVLNYINETIAAYFPTDHNDIAFLCYVTASLWAFSEHILNSTSKKWIILIGVFSGLAILTKWLVGLLVYSGWLFYTVLNNSKTFYLPKHYYSIIKALLITIAIAAPWQVYILTNYPTEAKYEYSYNSKHLTEVIEGHGGDEWFHLDNFKLTIGRGSVYFLLLGIFLLYSQIKNKIIYWIILFFIAVVFLFFSFFAVTKMPAFTLIIYPLIMLGLASIPVYLSSALGSPSLNLHKSIMMLAGIIIAFILLKIETTQELHTEWKKNLYVYETRVVYQKWKKKCNYIKSLKLDKSYVVYNCGDFNHISFMFYTDYIGMWGYPDTESISVLKSKNKKIAVINDGHLPALCLNNKDVLVIDIP